MGCHLVCRGIYYVCDHFVPLADVCAAGEPGVKSGRNSVVRYESAAGTHRKRLRLRCAAERSKAAPGRSRCSMSAASTAAGRSCSPALPGNTGRCRCDLSGQRGDIAPEAAGSSTRRGARHAELREPRSRRPRRRHARRGNGFCLPGGSGGTLSHDAARKRGLYDERHTRTQHSCTFSGAGRNARCGVRL